MAKKNLKTMTSELIDSLTCDDGMADAEAGQDARYEIDEAAEKILLESGYTKDDEDWDEMLENLAGKVEWIPAHFRLRRGR